LWSYEITLLKVSIMNSLILCEVNALAVTIGRMASAGSCHCTLCVQLCRVFPRKGTSLIDISSGPDQGRIERLPVFKIRHFSKEVQPHIGHNNSHMSIAPKRYTYHQPYQAHNIFHYYFHAG
jgi:hypothetical protein